MKKFRYSGLFLICLLLMMTSGCGKDNVSVVNAHSAIVIHSSDFGVTGSQNSASVQKQSKKESSKVTVKNNVVRLGDGYEDVDLGPSFRF